MERTDKTDSMAPRVLLCSRLLSCIVRALKCAQACTYVLFVGTPGSSCPSRKKVTILGKTPFSGDPANPCTNANNWPPDKTTFTYTCCPDTFEVRGFFSNSRQLGSSTGWSLPGNQNECFMVIGDDGEGQGVELPLPGK